MTDHVELLVTRRELCDHPPPAEMLPADAPHRVLGTRADGLAFATAPGKRRVQ
jgi:hypothetical protein